ncbi:MAG: DUF3021 domain-containing protein [Lachnospiraceae bacterium]|nr:DUF3021 domain-containing protein [Lachnospiraceae bacterium]
MKKIIEEFFRRGLIACGFGPIVLAIVYLVLQNNGAIETLTVNQVCIGIFSITALAFIAGSMNTLYQIERLPLMVAILIHGVVLYFTYLGTFLFNDWLKLGLIPFLIFTGAFVVGYLVIWVIIYSIISKRAATLNMLLEQKQQSLGEM